MIIDIILILFIALGAFFGFKKGLINVVFSIVTIVISIILSLLLQAPVSNAISKSKINDNINVAVKENIQNIVSNKSEDNQNNKIYDMVLKQVLSEDNISQQANKITMFIIRGISFIAVFIIVTVILFILKSVLNLVFDLPLLHSINKIGGLGVGAIKNIVIIYVVLALIAFTSPLPFVTNNVAPKINNTIITKILYNNNLLVNVMSSHI